MNFVSVVGKALGASSSQDVSGGFQLPEKPELRKTPIAQDGLGRNLQDFRDLIRFHSAKKFELHDLALARIGFGKALQRIVQCDQVCRARRGKIARFVQRKLLLRPPRFTAL